jgi:hypothetical protein
LGSGVENIGVASIHYANWIESAPVPDPPNLWVTYNPAMAKPWMIRRAISLRRAGATTPRRRPRLAFR